MRCAILSILLIFLLCGNIFGYTEAACWAPLWLPAASAAALTIFPALAELSEPSGLPEIIGILAASGAIVGFVAGVTWGIQSCYIELIEQDINAAVDTLKFDSALLQNWNNDRVDGQYNISDLLPMFADVLD